MSVTIVQGDCLEVLRTLPDASVDAVVCDPPYCSGGFSEAGRQRAAGQGIRSENLRRDGWFKGDNMGTAGLCWLLRTLAVQARRLMRGSGSMLVFCDWRMVPNIVPALESAGLRYQNLIVWDKRAAGLGAGFRARHELVVHLTNGEPEYFHQGTGNVLQCARVPAATRDHQAQKPVELMSQLIRVVCPPGGVVLDPFAGSGSTGIAALETGRRAVLIEGDPEHVETIRARCKTTHAELPL